MVRRSLLSCKIELVNKLFNEKRKKHVSPVRHREHLFPVNEQEKDPA